MMMRERRTRSRVPSRARLARGGVKDVKGAQKKEKRSAGERMGMTE